jgi:hypothetical protein
VVLPTSRWTTIHPSTIFSSDAFVSPAVTTLIWHPSQYSHNTHVQIILLRFRKQLVFFMQLCCLSECQLDQTLQWISLRRALDKHKTASSLFMTPEMEVIMVRCPLPLSPWSIYANFSGEYQAPALRYVINSLPPMQTRSFLFVSNRETRH